MGSTIQSRFFVVFDKLVEKGQIKSLQSFCEKFGFNRTRYSHVRNGIRNPENLPPSNKYRYIDIDAIEYICNDYGVSTEWLVLGKGKMFNNK
jgi:hypothetical protein